VDLEEAMTKKPLYMESTEIPPERTAGEIAQVLVTAGATQIATEYEDGKVRGLRWTMRINGRELLFSMPVRVEPIFQILHARVKDRWGTDADKIRVKAERVAWRQLLRWVQAQMAMIECGMSEASEVFLPYMQTASGQTLFEALKGSGFKQIAGPEQTQ
jgi:hypothetical protein